LKQLNVADNLLTALPVSLRAAESLQRLFAYNNRLQGLESIACLTAGGGGSESRRGASGCDSSASPPSPEHQESDWVSLESVWLEGNPLCQEAVSELLTKAPAGMTGLKSLGLDLQQVWRSIMDILFISADAIAFGNTGFISLPLYCGMFVALHPLGGLKLPSLARPSAQRLFRGSHRSSGATAEDRGGPPSSRKGGLAL